jgi:hypothetical protein
MNFRICILALLTMGACHSKSPSEGTDVRGDSVLAFLHGQISRLDAGTASLTLYNTHNGKEDSSHIRTSDVQSMTAPFLVALSSLSTGQGTASGWASLYKESSFPDSSNYRTVISFQALSDSTPLNMVDVYINPDTKSIRKMYLQYSLHRADSSVSKQLIWETDKSFTLITTIDKNEYTADLLQQKVVWDKP